MPDRQGFARPERAFYEVDAADLARGLIGCVLARREAHGGWTSGVIVETEAYLGVQDRASHAYGGRRTARNESMYAAPGTAYVYFTYGMHHCFNVSCGAEGEPAAVLVRALRPLEGLETMHRRRDGGRGRTFPDIALCRGPGNLCRAMGIDRAMDGTDLLAENGVLTILLPVSRSPGPRLQRGPRIGLGEVGEWKEKPLRWWAAGEPAVSGGRAKV